MNEETRLRPRRNPVMQKSMTPLTQATELCTVAPKMCGSTLQLSILLKITQPRIMRRILKV